MLPAARARVSRMPGPRPAAPLKCRVWRVARDGLAFAAVGLYRQDAGDYLAVTTPPVISVLA